MDLKERARKEKEAREKWLASYNDAEIKQRKRKERQQKIREELMLEANKKWEAYKESDDYQRDKRMQHEQTLANEKKVRDKAISLINEYREKYKMKNQPVWKVYQKVITTEGLNNSNLFPNWVHWQLTTENLVGLDTIKQMKNTKQIRFHGHYCLVDDDYQAMYLFGQRLIVCYHNTYDPIEDVVWSYKNNNENNYIDFYYNTSHNEPNVNIMGFLLNVPTDIIDCDLKVIEQESIINDGEIYHTKQFLNKHDGDELFQELYDKFVNTKQTNLWLGDHGYSDGGDILKPTEIPPIVWEIKRKIEKTYGIEFNGCLVSLYDSYDQENILKYKNEYTALLCLGLSLNIKSLTNMKHRDLLVMRKGANPNEYYITKNHECNDDNVRIVLEFRLYDYSYDEQKYEALPF